ncbi:neuroplastin [Nematostella vectensis]|uniref:neuroplastin n=1 Tax=Nematostella vectensis TaxID=45351 RepID=UPI002076FE2A|nr:neuroplastin [Nematostella vectensis]
MARCWKVVMKTLVVFVLSFALLVNGQGFLTVVDPKPENMFVIEQDPDDVQSTKCIGMDLNVTHPKTPTNLTFHKVTWGIADVNPLVSDDMFTFNVSFQEEGKKVIGEMKVMNVTLSRQGQYQCWILPDATGPGGFVSKHGFSLTVIPRSELPDIAVAENRIDAKFDQIIYLVCNLTKKGAAYTSLTRMEWLKDGVVIEKQLYPKDEQLKPLNLTIKNPEQGGVYTCRLTSLLRSVRTYNLTEQVTVTVAPKAFASTKPDEEGIEIVCKKGESVRMKCEHKGNPISVGWDREPKNGQRAPINDSHYQLVSKNAFEGFELVIDEVQYNDRGDYFCCIKNATGHSRDCQKYTLRVKDPLGYLWPLIGIIVEIIVLIIILVIYEKCKKKQEDDFGRTDGNTDITYTTSPSGDKASLRLRKGTGQ